MAKITPTGVTPNYDAPPGPVKSGRKCRDVFWLLLFVAYWVGMIAVAIVAMTNGSTDRLLIPQDSQRRSCGKAVASGSGTSYDFTAKPYLFFFNPMDRTAHQVCVATCPTATKIPAFADNDYICIDGVVPSSSIELLQKMNSGDCSPVVYQTQAVLNRCLPAGDFAAAAALGLASTAGAGTTDAISAALAQGLSATRTMVSDFMATWQWMLGALGCSVVASFIWLLVLRVVGGLLTWFTLFAVECVLGGFAYYSYQLWQTKMAANAAIVAAGGTVTTTATQTEQASLGLFIVCASVFGILLLMIIALRKRIMIATKIIKEAAKAVHAMPSLIVFPVLPFVLIVLLVVYYAAIALYIETAPETAELAALGVNQSFAVMKYLHWYHLFGFLWTLALIVAINQTTIAGAVATWYWARDKSKLGLTPVLSSFGRVLRYHLGSLAFGSFLIAVVQIIRIILAYMQKQLRTSNNRVAKIVLGCLQCCFYCLEKFIKFLNKNAYIMIAINGQSFCSSARTAAELLIRNAFRLIAIDFVAGFILFLSKVVVAGGTAFGLYATLNMTNAQGTTATQNVAVVSALVFLAAWMITSCFFGVYKMAIDTVFLSFCEDCERNDGSAEKPYFMSPELMALTDVKPQGAPDIAKKGGAGAAQAPMVKKSGAI